MITEKMLELLLLKGLIEETIGHPIIEFNGKHYNNEEMYKRMTVLLEEFLEPYVIESTSKEG